MDDATRDSIVSEMIAGRSMRAIAAQRDISVEQVRQAIDEAALALQRGETIRHDILTEKGRLDELLRVFFGQAKTGDVASGALYSKLSERKASLLGLNAPVASAVTIAIASAPKLSSTQELLAALDRVADISSRERELSNRERDGDELTIAEIEELDRYRFEREEKRRADHDAAEAARKAKRAGAAADK